MKLETYLSGVEKASWACGIVAGEFVAEGAYKSAGSLRQLKRRRRQCSAFKEMIVKMAGVPGRKRKKL